MEELIQNTVLNREGRKWKERWASLKRVSPKTNQATNQDTYLLLFLYKSKEHAVEGKEKYVLPLMDYCGREACKEYDKSNDVLVLITASQTSFLSFEKTQVRDQWIRILDDHFGQAVFTCNINIPDKQKRKYGESTIRIYRSFFSITTKNYKCLNRWFTNDIRSFSAEGDSQFMFEIGPKNKSNKSLLVNIIIPNNAEEIARTFESLSDSDEASTLVDKGFTGSSILIDIGQAKRNAGDRNFIRRAILRASDRLRKKHRNRSRSEPPTRKNLRPSNSLSDENKFCSLDRRKSPDIGVQINEDSKEKAVKILRSVSSPARNPISSISRQISIDEPPPPVPSKKKSPTSSSSSQPIIEKKPENTSKGATERTLLKKPRSMTVNDIPIQKNIAKSNEKTTKSEEQLPSVKPEGNLKTNPEAATDECAKKLNMTFSPTDKSEIIRTQPRRSTDGVVNNNYKQPTNPAHYAISKTKRKDKKTPTPPPRSPVSLGLPTQSNVFDFPPTEEIVNDVQDGQQNDKRKSSLLSEIDKEVKRRTVHSEDLSDDAFASSEPSPLHFDYSNVDNMTEPAYGNIDQLRKDSSDDNSQRLAIHDARRWRNSAKHLSDPLSFENWTLKTGDGQQISSSSQNFHPDHFDYINVKSNVPKDDDSDNGSYVNVSTSESGKPEIGGNLKKGKRIPKPLNLNRPQLRSYKNEFEKYDDDDSSIYHPVVALNNSTSSIHNRRPGGSYENMTSFKTSSNTNQNHNSDYLNLMSPNLTKQKTVINSSKLNYAIIPGQLYSKSVSTSPIRVPARSPIEKPNKSDYTLIDEVGTSVLNRTFNEHSRQFSTGIRTPTKNAK